MAVDTIPPRWWKALLLFLLLCTVVLSALPHLSQSYWIDELLTQEMAEKHGLGDLLVSSRSAMAAPPLSHLMIRSLLFLGHDEWVGRLPSLLLSLLAVLYAYGLGRRLGGEATGMLTAAFMATAPLLLRYAEEARPYAHFIFFTTATMYYVVRLISRPAGAPGDAPPGDDRFRVGAPLFLMMVCGLFSHFYYVFVGVGLGAMIPLGLWRIRQWSHPTSRLRPMLTTVGSVLLLVLLVAALYYPFYRFYKPRLEHLGSGGSKSETPVTESDLGPRYATMMISPGLLGYAYDAHQPPAPVSLPSALTLAAFVFVVYGAVRLGRARRGVGTGLILVLLFGYAICGWFLIGRNFFHHRYFVFQAPFIALFLAYAVLGVSRLLARWKYIAAAVPILIAGGIVVIRLGQAAELSVVPTGFKSVGETVVRYYKPGDQVMILGPRSAFDENMYFAENYEARYPLRDAEFFDRVGYLPTEPLSLSYILDRPGDAWLMQVYYAAFPPETRQRTDEFIPFLEARQCNLWLHLPGTEGLPRVSPFRIGDETIRLGMDRFTAGNDLARRGWEDEGEVWEMLPGGVIETRVFVEEELPLQVRLHVRNRGGRPGEVVILSGTRELGRMGVSGDRDWKAIPGAVGDVPAGTTTLRIRSEAPGSIAVSEVELSVEPEVLLAQVQHPRRAIFGDRLEFLGYDINPPGPLAPGDTFEIDYYWRARARMDKNYRLVVRMDGWDALEMRRWVRVFNDHGGFYGLHPTTRWRPGEVVRERYRITIPETYPEGPAALHMTVSESAAIGTYDREHSFEYFSYLPWSARFPDELFTAGALEISNDRQPVFRVTPDSADLGRRPREWSDRILLYRADLSARRDGANATLNVDLLLQCFRPMQFDYKMIFTLKTPDGRTLLSSAVGPVRQMYPTYVWERGEFIEDRQILTWKPEAGVDEVDVYLGWSEAFYREGALQLGETLGEPIRLGRVRLGAPS